MIGERNSFTSNVLLNPLVWIGVTVAILHLSSKSGQAVWNVFRTPETYINLIIGAMVYTALFDRHYTKDRAKLAIMENIYATLTNAYIIFFSWLTVVFVITNYHETGLSYSVSLRKRLAEEKAAAHAPAVSNAAPQINNLNIESGKRYKLTPNADGSFILEVMED